MLYSHKTRNSGSNGMKSPRGTQGRKNNMPTGNSGLGEPPLKSDVPRCEKCFVRQQDLSRNHVNRSFDALNVCIKVLSSTTETLKAQDMLYRQIQRTRLSTHSTKAYTGYSSCVVQNMTRYFVLVLLTAFLLCAPDSRSYAEEHIMAFKVRLINVQRV